MGGEKPPGHFGKDEGGIRKDDKDAGQAEAGVERTRPAVGLIGDRLLLLSSIVALCPGGTSWLS